MTFEPYENQLIGAFLFQLGRMTPKDQTTAINLFQQTPLDRAFGDLVVGTHRCFVLEFKRNSKQVAMEARKWTERGLQELLDGHLDHSRKGHFIIYGLLTGDTVDMHMCGYLNALNPAKKLEGVPADTIIRQLALGVFSQEHQTTEPASAARPDGLAPNEMVAYLKWLRTARRKDEKAESTGGREAWLGVATSDKGMLYVAADSLNSLLQIDRSLERERELQIERSRSRDLGHSL
jgi:hypothetical protein